MGFFKEVGDWFKDLFKEDVTAEKEQQLIGQLAGMDTEERARLDKIVKEYGESFRPEDKTFEYLEEYTPIDEQTLKEQSRNQYVGIYEDETKKANEKYQDKLNKVEETEKGYIDDAEAKSDNYKEKYKTKTEDFKSSASKNGIADSSIMGAKSSDLENERDRYIDEVMTALKNKLNTTKNKKEDIVEEKEAKLQALDSNFSKNVENLFNKLLKEENKKVEDVKKANKAIADEEKNYKDYQEKIVKEKTKEMEDLHKKMQEEEANGNFTSAEREEEYNERLKLAKEFYSKFSKQSALKAIQSNSLLKNLLGPKYYRLIGDIQNG